MLPIKSMLISIFWIALHVGESAAQGNTPVLVSSTNSLDSPRAALKDVEWLTGRWKGEAFGGNVEEIWSRASDNSLTGMFILKVNGEIRFHEFMEISAQGKSLTLHEKNYQFDQNGWEERYKTNDFPLVKIATNKIYFNNVTFEKISDDKMIIHRASVKENDVMEIISINFFRVKN